MREGKRLPAGRRRVRALSAVLAAVAALGALGAGSAQAAPFRIDFTRGLADIGPRIDDLDLGMTPAGPSRFTGDIDEAGNISEGDFAIERDFRVPFPLPPPDEIDVNLRLTPTEPWTGTAGADGNIEVGGPMTVRASVLGLLVSGEPAPVRCWFDDTAPAMPLPVTLTTTETDPRLPPGDPFGYTDGAFHDGALADNWETLPNVRPDADAVMWPGSTAWCPLLRFFVNGPGGLFLESGAINQPPPCRPPDPRCTPPPRTNPPPPVKGKCKAKAKGKGKRGAKRKCKKKGKKKQ